MGVKLAIYPTKTSKINNKSKKFKTGIVLSCIFSVLFVLLAFNFFQILTKIFVGTFGLLIYPVCLFFVGGQWVEKEPEMLSKIVSSGHEIANHGYFHKDQEYLDYNQNYQEIKVNHELVKTMTGVTMNLFAPPSGSFNKSTIKACFDLGYQTIMWTKDTIDWRDKDANLIYSRATNKLKGGDLILAHPTQSTLSALPLILEYFKLNNFEATTVSNCLK